MQVGRQTVHGYLAYCAKRTQSLSSNLSASLYTSIADLCLAKRNLNKFARNTQINIPIN